jgi:hypothetical protein
MGAENVTIYDPQTVEAVNTGTQGYSPRDVSYKKVAAALGACQTLNSAAVEWRARCGSYPDAFNFREPHAIMFLAVDTMRARKVAVGKQPPSEFLIDTRMAIRTGRIVTDAPPFKYWKSTYFSDAKGLQAPCTRQATYFNAAIVANWAVAMLIDYLGGIDPPRDLQIETLGHFAAEMRD